VLFGDSIDVDEHGEEISGDTLLLLFNGDQQTTVEFTLPATDEQFHWQRMLDTAHLDADRASFEPGQKYALEPATLVLFRLQKPDAEKTL
jgi:hypothetical protein